VVARRLFLCSFFLLTACEDEPATTGPDLSVNGVTIPCAKQEDCPANLPMCHPDSHVCVGCSTSFETCSMGLTCDEATHTCIPADPQAPCTRNPDCPRLGFDSSKAVTCLVDAGICVECANNVDCVALNGGLGVCLPDYTCQADGGS
jgi:hypothetical protein